MTVFKNIGSYLFLTCLLAIMCLSWSCKKDINGDTAPTVDSASNSFGSNSLLLFKIDYLTNDLEGGSEMIFSQKTKSFTLDTIYQAPGDFGYIQFRYKELDTTIFNGSMVWSGKGHMYIPDTLRPATSYERTIALNYIAPKKGIENIFNPSNTTFDYTTMWSNLQTLTIVRKYFDQYPDADVYTFLYTPSVGFGDPSDWFWVVLIKN